MFMVNSRFSYIQVYESYWPAKIDEFIVFDDITVTLSRLKLYKGLTLRKLLVTKSGVEVRTAAREFTNATSTSTKQQ